MCDVIHHPTNFSFFFLVLMALSQRRDSYWPMREEKEKKIFICDNDTHKRVAPRFFMPLPRSSKFSGLEIQLFLWKQGGGGGGGGKSGGTKKKNLFFFFFLSYIWRGRWRLTRNAAPSFFNFFFFSFPFWPPCDPFEMKNPFSPRGFSLFQERNDLSPPGPQKNI